MAKKTASLSKPAPGPEPLKMTVSREQAGVMALFGAGLLFCGVLLGASVIQRFLPMFWKVSVGLAALFVGWVGASLIFSGIRGTRDPVFTLREDALVCHDAGGDWELPLAEIESASFKTTQGVKSLILKAGGRTVAIPETLVRSEEAFARLGPPEETSR